MEVGVTGELALAALHPPLLAGPDERAQPAGAVFGRDVDRRAIDADPAADGEIQLQQTTRDGPPLLAVEAQDGVLAPPRSCLVAVPVAVPDEVEPRARPELDEVESLCAHPLSDTQKKRHQDP